MGNTFVSSTRAAIRADSGGMYYDNAVEAPNVYSAIETTLVTVSAPEAKFTYDFEISVDSPSTPTLKCVTTRLLLNGAAPIINSKTANVGLSLSWPIKLEGRLGLTPGTLLIDHIEVWVTG
jgi:hypothetical protein